MPLKSVLLSAHLRVMGFLSGWKIVVTGVVSNGRPETAEAEEVLGLFLNTLPCRLSLEDESWAALVGRVFRLEQEMLEYRRYPMAQIQKDLTADSLFDTAFNFTNFHALDRLKTESGIELLGGKSYEELNFTLLSNFVLSAVDAQLRILMEYDRGAIKDEEIDALFRYLREGADGNGRRFRSAIRKCAPAFNAMNTNRY